jgi:HAD superfamily hydrolase (TIGR01509 family)
MKKAVIFDMDGVVSDTQKIHSRVWSLVMGKYGINISPDEVTYKLAGQKVGEAFGALMKEYGLEQFLGKALDEKERMMQEPRQRVVKPIKGIKMLLKKLHRDGRDIALATGSGLASAERVLGILEIRDYFKVLVTADDVTNGKPDPEVYLKTAHKLGRDPSECVVVEDARNGMLAAKLAGMTCIGLVSENFARENYPADLFVHSLDELTLASFN